MHQRSAIQLRVGTRTSPLARWQTDHIIALLAAAWPHLACVVLPFTTQGDRTQAANKPLPEIGGKGLFTLELEEALRRGEIDLAVHSLKDLPVADPPGLAIGAIPGREDVRDALVARNDWTLASLPPGATVGTSSTRRAVQLLAVRPDLQLRPIRGNVETRLRKVQAGDYDATILAAAGLSRLQLTAEVNEWLPLDVMLPAPGQGALAVQCRADDAAVLALLAAIDDARVRLAVTAERSFLHALGGGCSAPVAAYARPLAAAPGELHMQALVAAPDGRRVVRVSRQGPASTLGEQLAAEALAQGAAHLLTPPVTDPSATSHPAQPLAGKRIVLTRPREQVQALVDQLTALGAEPLVMPTIRIAPLPDLDRLDRAIAGSAGYDWLVFTSANAVTIFGERWRRLGQSTDDLRQTPVAVVGPATTAAVRELGAEPAFVPAQYRAETLASGLGDVAGRRILLPQAAAASPALAQQLRQRGALVDQITIYTTEPVALTPSDQAELAKGVAAILLTSGSTVANFVAALENNARAWAAVRQALIVCIGPVTAAAAAAVGLTPTLVADQATGDGLIDALCRHFATPKGDL